MLRFILLFLLIYQLSHSSYGCTCPELEKKDIKSILEKYDLVILGTVAEIIGPEGSNKYYSGDKNGEFEVKIIIDSVLTGITDQKYLIVVQFGSDNCERSFKPGEQYVILGDLIRQFINKTPEYNENEDEIPVTIQPPPPPAPGGLVHGNLNCYNMENSVIEFWNQIVQKETVIYTNLCASFPAKSVYGSYFLQ